MRRGATPNAMLQPDSPARSTTLRGPRRFFFDREAELHAALGAREAPAAPAARHAEGGVREGAAPPDAHAGRGHRAARPALDDLGRLPFTLKSDLRDHYPFGLFARPRAALARLHASSGTTGKPTVVGYTARHRDLGEPDGALARLRRRAPGRRGAQRLRYGLFTGGLGAHYGAERLGATVVPMSGGATERQVLLIRISAHACCARRLRMRSTSRKSSERDGAGLRGGTLEIGIFGAEPWSEAMRREIEARLGIKALDIYGLSEILGPA